MAGCAPDVSQNLHQELKYA